MTADLLSMPMSAVPLAFIDFEMTGLESWDEPIEVAVVHLDPGELLPRLALHTAIRPDVEMSRGAMRVTGVTDADLRLAPHWSAVSAFVLDALDGRAVVAYNAPADFEFLTNAQTRIQGPAPIWPWLDPLVMVKELDKYEKVKTLAAACARAGIAVDAHGAAGDAISTALLWGSLIRRHYGLEKYVLADFFEVQGQRAIAQEVDFVSWVRRTHGTRGPRPECRWHELLGVALPEWPEPPAPVGRCGRCQASGVVYQVNKAGVISVVDGHGEPHVCIPATLPPPGASTIPF